MHIRKRKYEQNTLVVDVAVLSWFHLAPVVTITYCWSCILISEVLRYGGKCTA